MPLDPQARLFLDQLAASGMPPIEAMTPADARLATVAMLSAVVGDRAELASVRDLRVPGPAGGVPVRVYVPEGRVPQPILVYFHGGGFVIGDLESHDPICRVLAGRIPAIVVAVDYRLAPEHPFPAALDDCYAATCWVAEHARDLAGDPARLAVGGDSAGGNLAASVSILARDRGAPAIAHQLLVYPVTDSSFDTPSHVENAEGYLLTRATMTWFLDHYLRTPADRVDPRFAVLRAPDLSGLPPATVLTAEFDPLRDEGERYAARLGAAGVPVEARRFDGIIHGFFTMPALFAHAETAIDAAAAALRRAFGPRP
jgi:acetyl esterase